MPRSKHDTTGKTADDERWIHQSIRMPGDQNPATCLRDAFDPAHLHAAKEQSYEKPDQAHRVALLDHQSLIVSGRKGDCPLFTIRARPNG